MKISITKQILASAVALSIILLGGCGDSSPSLASVNGKAVTESQFTAYLKFKNLNARDEKRKQALLDQYLERAALAAVIEKEGKYDKELAAAELEEFRKQMLISRYFDQYLKQQVTDTAAKNYYAANIENYQERKVHVAHILLRTKRNMSEEERAAKLTRAQAAYSELNTNKEFAEIAKNHSEDAISSKKGGDLGWLKEGAIDPRFSNKVFSMKPGDISEPFETAFGFHIVKLLEGPLVVKRPFQAVSGDIRYLLRNKAKLAEIQRIKSQVKISKQGK